MYQSAMPIKSATSLRISRSEKHELTPESNVLNNEIHKNKFQMPNKDSLFQPTSQTLSANTSQQTKYFITIDLLYV